MCNSYEEATSLRCKQTQEETVCSKRGYTKEDMTAYIFR